MLSKYNSR